VIGDDLRISGGVALARRLRPDQDGDAAVVIEANARGVGAVVAARLDVGRDADAAQSSDLARLREPPFKSVPVGAALRAAQMAGEVARIVGLAGRGRVRHGLDEVLAP